MILHWADAYDRPQGSITGLRDEIDAAAAHDAEVSKAQAAAPEATAKSVSTADPEG